jgi:hypothetical protein
VNVSPKVIAQDFSAAPRDGLTPAVDTYVYGDINDCCVRGFIWITA